MTVDNVRIAPPRRPGTPVVVRPGVGAPAIPPTQRTAPRLRTALCLTVPQILDGDATGLIHTLRRRQGTRAVLLTRRAGRRELVILLSGGIRGAVAAEAQGAALLPTQPAPVVAPGAELTARELGVLKLVADGRSNRQIGEILELSALTVKSHLARISRKVGTGDRAEMVAYVIRRSLLP